MQIYSRLQKLLFVAAHILLWLLIVVACEMALADFIPQAIAWKRALYIVGLSAAVFYIHAEVLINFLFEKRRWLRYFTALLLLTLLSIGTRIFVDRQWKAIALPDSLRYMTPSHRGFLFLPTLLAIVVSTFYQLLLNRYNRERQYLIQINELGKAQLAFLKNQINPHFLFNNLNNIYSMIVTGSPGAGDAVLRLSELLRYVIYKSDDGKVFLEEECVQVGNLIALFKLKEEGQHVSLDTADIKTNAALEPMLLIPLVENCFKHCDDITQPGSFIAIIIRADDEWISCITENTMPEHENKEIKKGVGLHNIRQRLKHIYGDENYLLDISQNKNIFTTKLQIRWKKTLAV